MTSDKRAGTRRGSTGTLEPTNLRPEGPDQPGVGREPFVEEAQAALVDDTDGEDRHTGTVKP